MAGGAERGDVLGPQVLHLVDQQGDAGSDVLGELGDLGEQLDQVDLDVARVRAPVLHRDVDAGLPALPQLRTLRRRPERERLEHPQHLVDALGGTVPDGQVADRAVQRRGQRTAQVGVRPGLDLPGAPAGVHRHRAQLAEQDRLADAAQPGEHQAPLGATTGDPFQDDLEGVHLAVPAGQLGRALTRAGGERVAHRIHATTVSADLRNSVDDGGVSPPRHPGGPATPTTTQQSLSVVTLPVRAGSGIARGVRRERTVRVRPVNARVVVTIRWPIPRDLPRPLLTSNTLRCAPPCRT